MAGTQGRTARRIGWKQRWTAALVVVLFSVTPASNQIYRYTDSQGTVHITNVAASEPAGTTATYHLANPPIMRSAAFVDSFQSEPGQPYPHTKVPTTAKITKHIDKSGVIRITNRSGNTIPSTGQQTQLEEARQKMGVATTGAVPPRLAGSLLTESSRVLSAARGHIHCRRDSQGVFHISNSPPLAVARAPVPTLENNYSRHTIATQPPGTDMTQWAKLSPTQALAEIMQQLPKSIGRSSPQIRAVLDRQGILRVSNVFPSMLNPGPRGLTLPQPKSLPALEPVIREASQRYYLPIPLIQALIKVESNFVPEAISPKGAQGLMQLMPATATYLGVKDPFCPRENVLAGCLYLRLLLNYLHQSLPLALAAYNAGYQRVVTAGYRVPDIKETREFVTRVIGLYLHYEKLRQWPWKHGGI
ncbi:MAG: transglycosylase SLT domain-containing protein [Deltaproteobacteria bacterium]|nr:transglycosylase SLT domain-containing protein [Deltaproteobacteria bacterium]